MSRYERRLLIGTGLAVIGLGTLLWLMPQPVDWTHSFERDDTRPYGSQVLYELLPTLFPRASVRPVRTPPYRALRDTTTTDTNYLFITDAFAPDEAETRKLLHFVARGNTAFVAARYFRGPLADSLHLTTAALEMPSMGLSADSLQLPDSLQASTDSLRLRFTSPAVQQAGGYRYEQRVAGGAFTRFDTLRARVLSMNGRDEVTYLRSSYGEGAFYLSTTPLVFTNYAMLTGSGAGYVYRALSYLPVRSVWWDAHYKPARVVSTSPLRFVMSTPALKGAFGVLVSLVVLFILFRGKRRQRVIPVVEPPRNETADFVRTVGRLYFERGDHANLARKKITYFLDYVRTTLGVPTDERNEERAAQVAERSGVPKQSVRALFRTIARFRDRQNVSEEALQKLCEQIESFYRRSER